MPRLFFLLAIGSLLLSACSPALNWRSVRIDGTPLKALLPCQPDHGSRPMALAAERSIEIHMTGCEAEGTLFALAWVEAGEPAAAQALAAQWQTAMLSQMRAGAPQVLAFKSSTVPQAVRLAAQGQRPDGRAVAAQGLWWTQGTQVFHAALYADVLSADVAETFFSGIELQ